MKLPQIVASFACLLSSLIIVPATGAAFVDPTKDTFGTGPVQVDISSYDALYSGGRTTFTVNFAGTISAASAFATNSLYGFIDLDLDRTASTGGFAALPGVTANLSGGNNWINYYQSQGVVPGPSIALGAEAFVDLGSEANHAGQVDVISALDNSILSTVSILYTTNSISLTIPLVGTGSNPALGFDLLVGTSAELTDRASNAAVADLSHAMPTTAVPEPTSLTLLGLGCVVLTLRGSRRRRAAS